MSKADSEKAPSFLSGSPCGFDKFEGKSQEKLASIITQLIKDDLLEKKVIGLEGEWGAGKSNVIEIIKKELGQDYTTFIFDAWGHQEDLTRKAFLEELIEQLSLNGFLEDKKKWRQKKNELLARKTMSTTQIFPKVKPYWVLFTIGVFLFALLSAFYTHVLKDFEFIPEWNAGWLKPLISVFLIPSIPIITGLVKASFSYFEERKENLDKTVLEREDKWQSFSKIFYWLNGDQLETEEKQNVIEDEPTVRQFRKYFNLIQDDIGNKGLVIIFDNLDRLEHEKVRALWSSIHTFFAEKSYKKTWVIVPYYKEKLIEIFETHDNTNKELRGKGFIEKTFALNFRVSPPIASDWDKLLKEKLHEAFGGKIIPVSEIPYLVSIFDFHTPDNTIKPRQIINFVNELVALCKLWKESVENGEIKFRYLALFIMSRDELLLNPVESILSREYLRKSQSLFNIDEDVDNIISALTFNVSRSLADEVLLKRELTQSIRTGDTEAIKSAMSHKAFQKYFIEAYNKVEHSLKRNTLSEVIKCVSKTLPVETIDSYWENFAIHIGNVSSEFYSFKQDHRDILIHVPLKDSKRRLLRLLLEGHIANASIEDYQSKYIDLIFEVQTFIADSDIDVDLLELLTKQTFKPKPFLDAIRRYGPNYKELQIECNQESMMAFLYDENKSIKEDLVFQELDSLVLIKGEFDFKRIIEDISSILKTNYIRKPEMLRNIVSILKSLGGEKLSLTLPQQTYEELNVDKTDKSIFADVFAIAISDFKNAHNSGNFQHSLKTIEKHDLEQTANIIERYYGYGDLLKLIVTNENAKNYASLKQIAYSLTINGRSGSTLLIPWALENFNKILTNVFENDPEKSEAFVRRLNDSKNFYFTVAFSKIDIKFFAFFSIKNLELIETIVADSLKHLKDLNSDAILAALKVENRDFIILKSLLENKISVEFSDNFYEGYENYLNQIFDKTEQVPTDDFLLNVLRAALDNRILKGTYTRLREKILSTDCDLHELGIERIEFFIPDLISHGKLDRRAEAVSYKLVDYLFEDTRGIDLFMKNMEFFIPAIKNSGDYLEGAKMTISRNLSSIENDEQQKRLREELNIKLPDPDINKSDS